MCVCERERECVCERERECVCVCVRLNLVLNWTHVCVANLIRGIRRTGKKFGELSSFLIGRTFTARTCFG